MLVSSPGELLEETAQREGVSCMTVPMRRGMAPFHDLVSLFRLIVLLRRLRPDLTEFSTPKAGLLGSLAACVCRVPVRIYLLRGLKLETSSGWRRWILLLGERVAAACSHVVLCNSESLRAEALALPLARDKKLLVLGAGSSNGVNVERFRPGESDVRQRLNIGEDELVVGFVGRLTRDKGVPELLEAFDRIAAAHHQVRLLLVGWFDQAEDALAPELRTRIEQNSRIVCTGYVADTAPYYRAMDVMVLPSWREGFPGVVLEAGASQVPVVTTLSTGARDAVVAEVTGLLIPPGYPKAICEAVLKLLGNPELRRRMGLAARVWVTEHYAKTRVLGLTADLYSRLVAEAAGGVELLEPASIENA
jgi:glycosyltransferase involved in cell wall biosynthesis